MPLNSPASSPIASFALLNLSTIFLPLGRSIASLTLSLAGLIVPSELSKTQDYRVLSNSEGTITPARLSVREAIERPNGRKIVLRFKSVKQAIGDEDGLLSCVLGLLGSDYGKFSICEESWRKITTKDKVYNECIKQIFHFDEYNKGTIKKNILKSMEKSWKEARLRLYDAFYEPTFTTEETLNKVRRELIESIGDCSLTVMPARRS